MHVIFKRWCIASYLKISVERHSPLERGLVWCLASTFNNTNKCSNCTYSTRAQMNSKKYSNLRLWTQCNKISFPVTAIKWYSCRKLLRQIGTLRGIIKSREIKPIIWLYKQWTIKKLAQHGHPRMIVKWYDRGRWHTKYSYLQQSPKCKKKKYYEVSFHLIQV